MSREPHRPLLLLSPHCYLSKGKTPSTPTHSTEITFLNPLGKNVFKGIFPSLTEAAGAWAEQSVEGR